LFEPVIDRAVELSLSGPPQIQEVGFPLDNEMRTAWNQVKRHKRRMRRTRAAERELFTAAEEERRSINRPPTE